MNIKGATWGFGLMLLLVFALPASAANTSTPSTDAAAVKTTVTNYIEAYYTSDAALIESTLHPHYLKHTISRTETGIRITDRNGMEMVQDIRAQQGKITPPEQRIETITVLDVSGDIASAKLETAGWIDYLTLTKVDGSWKIISVVLRHNN
jgi:hypothetical protein